jgi:hypothetical protein
VATVCEVVLAIGLLTGWRLHWVAVAAGLLLTTFAVALAVALDRVGDRDIAVLRVSDLGGFGHSTPQIPTR